MPFLQITQRRIRRGPDDGTAISSIVSARPDAIGEPARVGDVIDRVGVLRAHARRLVPGQREQAYVNSHIRSR